MIYLLIGENIYARAAALKQLVGKQSLERYASEEINQSRLVDIFAGASLFSEQRVVVIDELSGQKSLWVELPDWLGRLDEATSLVLCETKPDKRTKTYKALQKQAKVIDCSAWTLRQTRQAEAWLSTYATEHGLKLSGQQVSQLVARAVRPSDVGDQPIIDQALLATVVAQLRHAPAVTAEAIDAVMAGQSHDNVFGLLDAALGGEVARLEQMLERLSRHQDGHRVMALLVSQGLSLAGLVLGRQAGQTSLDAMADDLGAHPYALRQLAKPAERLTPAKARQLIERLAWADEKLKRGAGPWQLITVVLVTLAHK